MKKICIILPKGLPVPNVLGGAIETLITDIININEIEKQLEITCVSMYNENAFNESKKYGYTKFIYIKNNFNYKIMALKVRILNNFGKKLNTYNELILKKIKNEQFDFIVVEDGAYMSFVSYLKYFKKEQMILHFHHNGKSDCDTDKTFNKFVAVSDFVKKNFSRSSSIKNCVTLRNGIDIDKFSKSISLPEKNSIRNKLGFKDSDFIVVFCGRLIKEKGILQLVKSFEKINNNDIKLLIIGSINFGKNGFSEYTEKLNEYIERYDDKIKFTGYVKNDELYKYYKISNMGILPSIWEDAAPLVVFEMMSCGLPVVITNSGGAPEMVPNGTIIVNKENNLEDGLAKAIVKMYKDSKLRNKLSKDGLALASSLTTKNFFDNFVLLLK